MAFLVHNVIEVVLITDRARAVALRHSNGSVLLVEEAQNDILRYQGRWLEGSYAALSSGTNTICFLNTTAYAHCISGITSMGDDDNSMRLLDRAHVQYKQISCGDTFTCGLRANDSRVECFGVIDYTEPIHLNSSAFAYSSIAAQWERYGPQTSHTCSSCEGGNVQNGRDQARPVFLLTGWGAVRTHLRLRVRVCCVQRFLRHRAGRRLAGVLD